MINLTSNNKLEENEISNFEEEIGFSLPDDYRTFLKDHNGGLVNNQSIYVDDLEQSMMMHVLYGIDIKRAEVLNLTYWLNEYEDELPESTLIIGVNSTGGFITYTTSGEDKGIYFWDHQHFFPQSNEDEGNTYYLADSFKEFVGSLKDES
ncbi:SMI1/KNR4 family protein [Cytophagaceae bacterium ABcell3]|nr:SMI1/KNR4 family protein [Cytophagaceae bacterium ABcell3]